MPTTSQAVRDHHREASDQIKKEIELRAPVSRVWRALTDSTEFGTWFGAEFEGPFISGATTRGKSTYEGCDGGAFDLEVDTIEPETLFSFRWKQTESSRVSTLVRFELDTVPDGTRLTVTESGFDQLPAAERNEAFWRNEGGWTQQMVNIENHVDRD